MESANEHSHRIRQLRSLGGLNERGAFVELHGSTPNRDSQYVMKRHNFVGIEYDNGVHWANASSTELIQIPRNASAHWDLRSRRY